MQIKIIDALNKLADSKNTFLELFENKNTSVEIYKPTSKDFQNPHERDEIYIIVSVVAVFTWKRLNMSLLLLIFSLCLQGSSTGLLILLKIFLHG